MTPNYQAYKVYDYWKEIHRDTSDWREWIPLPRTRRNTPNINTQDLMKELAKRKIQTSRNQDILRWGYWTQGTFTLKEAYRLHTAQQHNQKRDIWQCIWHSNLWPKITFFLWQILHHSNLTWDNLQK